MPTISTGELDLDISKLKKALDDATEDIKTANRLFKLETAGLDNWAKDSEGLAAKLKQLTRTLKDQQVELQYRKANLAEQQKESEKQRNEVKRLENALADLAKKGIGEETKEYKNLQSQLNSAKASLKDSEAQEKKFQDAVDLTTASIGKTEREIKKWEKAQVDLNKENESASKKVKDQEKQLNELKKEYAEVAVSQGKDSEAAKHLAAQIGFLSKDLKENKKALASAQYGSDQLDKSFDETGKTAKEAGDDIEKAGEQAGGFRDNFLAGIGVQAVTKLWDGLKNAIKGVTNALKDAVKESAAYGDEVLTMSKTTGLATETIQEFKYAEDLLDVSTGTMAASLKKLKAQISSANKGGAAATTAFENLGISIYNSNGQLRDSEDIYFDAIEALGKISNETERDAAAMDLFGKSATDLNPLIQAGSKELAKLRQEAHDMGAVLSDESLEALSATQDAMDRLSKKAQTLKTNLASKLAPSVEKVMDGLVKAFDSPLVQKGIDELASGIGEIIDKGGKLAGKVLPPIINYVKKLLPSWKELIKAMMSAAKNILPIFKSVLPVVVNLFQKLVPVIKNVVDVVGKLIKAITPFVNSVLKLVSTVLGDLIDDISSFVESWGPALVAVVKVIANALKPVIDALTTIHNVSNTILSPLKKLGNMFGSVFSGISESMHVTRERVEAVDTVIEHVTKNWSVLTEKQEENAQAAYDAATAYGDLSDELSNSYGQTQTEVGHINTLWEELGKLVDATGKVNDADSDRAHFITEELENLTGKEIEWNGNVISNYKDLAGEIENVIDLKRASALLDIQEQKANYGREHLSEYQATITDETNNVRILRAETQQALRDFMNSELQGQQRDLMLMRKDVFDILESARKSYNDAVSDFAKDYTGEKYEELFERAREFLSSGESIDKLMEIHANSSQIIKDSLELAQVMGGLEDAEDAFIGVNNQLDAVNAQLDEMYKTYEDKKGQLDEHQAKLDAAVEGEKQAYEDMALYEEAWFKYSTGAYKEVNDMLEENTVNKWKKAQEDKKIDEESYKDLQHDLKVKKEAYDRYKEALANGDKSRTAEGLEAARKEVIEMKGIYLNAARQLGKDLDSEAKIVGVYFSNGFIDGIKSMTQSILSTAKNVGNQAVSTLKNTLKISSPSKVTKNLGKFFDLGFAQGIRDNVSSVNSAVSALTDQSVSGLSGGSVKSTTQNFTQNIYAPQTPSRLELYRDAKNLLAMGGLA